jgi:glucose dehydrogenase
MGIQATVATLGRVAVYSRWPGVRGSEEGNFFALDAETGKPLWQIQLGSAIRANPISYSVDGKQYVAISAGYVPFVFGLA